MVFSNIATLILYFGTFISSSILMRIHQRLYIKKESNKWKLYIFLFISLLIPSIIAGIRYNVGTDYQSYYWLFELTRNSSFLKILNAGTEPLFLTIVKLSSYVLNNQYIYFFIFFLTIFIIYLSVREFDEINWGYSLMLWFLIAFSPTLNIMRQMLAASIVLYAIVNLYNNKLARYFIIMLIALLVHNIAAIGLIAFFLQSKNKYINGLQICLMLLLFITVPFSNFYISYIVEAFGGQRFEIYTSIIENFSLSPALRVLPILIPILLFRKSINKNFINANLFVNLKLFELFFRLFFSSINYGFRIAYFFNLIDVILVSMMFFSIKKKYERTALLVFVFIFYIFTFYFNTFINLNDGIVPYILGGN